MWGACRAVGCGLYILGTPHQTCRHGVNVGNFAEDILAADCHGAPGFPLRTGAHFVGESEAAASFTAAGKTGAQLAAGAVRQDLQTKYGKYGRSEALPTEAGLNCFATMSQLAYSGQWLAPPWRAACLPARLVGWGVCCATWGVLGAEGRGARERGGSVSASLTWQPALPRQPGPGGRFQSTPHEWLCPLAACPA